MNGILSNDEKSKIQKSNEDRKLQKKKKKSWVLSLYSLTNYAINVMFDQFPNRSIILNSQLDYCMRRKIVCLP